MGFFKILKKGAGFYPNPGSQSNAIHNHVPQIGYNITCYR